MIRMAVRGLRHRKFGFLATFVAVMFGAAIVMACGGLMETGVRSNSPAERLAAAQIVVIGKQSHAVQGADESTPLTEGVRIPAELVQKVAEVNGVAKAVGEVSFPATVGSGQQGLGHGWGSSGLAPYKIVKGTPPAHAGEVVLTNGKPGSKVEITVRGVPQTYTVSGVAHGPKGQVFFSDSEAAELAGHAGMVDTIGVTVAQGTDVGKVRKDMSKAVGNQVDLLTGADRGLAEHEVGAEKEGLIALAGSFGGIATMTMMFVVASTLALVAQHRHRELALMRTIGATPRQVRRMVLVEALMVSIPAAAAGCVPGLFLGKFLFERLAEHGVASPYITYRQGWLPLVTGMGAALLAAIGAAVIAGRKAGKTRPVEALADAGLQRKWFSWVRLISGLLFLAGGGALVIVTMAVMSGPLASATAGPAVLCWSIGIALLGPGITKLVVALLSGPARVISGTTGRLAILNVRARTTAMSGAVMPVMLASGIATSFLYMQTTQVAAGERVFTDTLRADAVVSSTAGGLRPGLLDQVRRTPGVAGASAYVTSTGVVDEPRKGFPADGTPLQGISAQGHDGPASVRVISGSLAGLSGDTVALPHHQASKAKLHLGDQITMTLGDGAQVEVRVVATFAAKRGYESILLPADLLAEHTRTGLPDRIMVKAADGTGTAQLKASLHKALPGLVVSGREEVIAENNEDLQTQAWVNYLIVGMIIAYTAVSVVNTLVASTVRRRREFGLQRLTGSTPAQVLRMMIGEGVLVALAGLLLGTLVAVLTVLPFSAKVGPVSGPVSIYLVIVGIAAVLTLGSTAIPAWLTLRSRPMAAASAAD